MSKRNGPIRNRSLSVPFWHAEKELAALRTKQDQNGHDHEEGYTGVDFLSTGGS